MREVTQMIVVLTVICTVCGVALSGFRDMTAERIENQILMNVQGPKVKRVLGGSENDLIADRKKIKINGEEVLLFIGKKEGKPWALAFETTGKGFGGPIKVMVGFDTHQNKITGIQIVSHKETPGVGSRVTEDQFTQRFNGLSVDIKDTSPKGIGEKVDAVSGATYSSNGVYEAIGKSLRIYPEIKKRGLAP
jgi:electron transport complex protein RnfG